MSVAKTTAVQHLAVVMDGNQRWARSKGLPGPQGHQEGAKAVKTLVKASVRVGIKYLTLFAFSSENWKRPAYEVDLLMHLFCTAIDEQLRELHLNKIRLRFLGDLSSFSQLLQDKMAAAEAKTQKNCGMQLIIAVNYGGQWDITEAAKGFALQSFRAVEESLVSLSQDGRTADLAALFQDVFQKELERRTQADFAQHLHLNDLPSVDLFVRTSGEQRISNFLLWQLAYAELYFTPTLWPDFNEESLHDALDDFASRQRRYGQSSEAILREQQERLDS